MTALDPRLKLTLTLLPDIGLDGKPSGEPPLFESGENTRTVEGLRMQVAVQSVGLVTGSRAQVKIWGLKEPDMNVLCTWGQRLVQRRAELVIEAGNGGYDPIFTGQTNFGRIDYNRMPDVAIELQAYGLYDIRVMSAESRSVDGKKKTLEDFAREILPGFNVEMDSSVTVKNIVDMHVSGSIYEQLKAVCDAYGLDYTLTTRTIRFGAMGTPFSDDEAMEISPATGLIGYPEMIPLGISATSKFIPEMTYKKKFTLKSSLKQANGTWLASNVSHLLSYELPGGPWFTRFDGITPGGAP